MTRSTVHTLGIAIWLGGCFRPALPSTSGGELTVSATDYRGEAVPLLELPRKPRLVLTHPSGIEPLETAFTLFPGAADTSWQDDLARAPLRAEHSAQAITCHVEPTSGGVVVTPQTALSPGTTYTFAVAAWAKTRAGTAFNDPATARLFALKTGDGETAGATVRATWPLAGTSGVSPQLHEVLLALDGIVQDAQAGIWLEGPNGLAVDADVQDGPCAALAPDLMQPHCVVLTPAAALTVNTPYRIVVGQAATDAHGAPIGPFESNFRTGDASDAAPPTLRAPACALDEQNLGFACTLPGDTTLHVRGLTDEPSRILAHFGGQTLGVASAAGEFSLRAADLEADRDVPLELSARNSGDRTVAQKAMLHTTPALARLSITEVLSDPLGPEPAQEWIEVLNYGEVPLDLDGFSLSNVASKIGQLIEHPPLIAPHTRALLVSDDYDPEAERDAKPPPGTTLIRMGRALAGDGLRNGGTALFIRDAQQHRVSAAPATPHPRAGQCIVRSTTDQRDGRDGTFEVSTTCTPGTDGILAPRSSLD